MTINERPTTRGLIASKHAKKSAQFKLISYDTADFRVS